MGTRLHISCIGLRAGALLALLTLGGCAELNALMGAPDPGRAQTRVEERSRARSDRAERNDRKERAERPAARAARPAPDRDDNALREGIGLYNDGEFNAAIKRLDSGDMDGGSARNRVNALKYTAFSYCVTGRPAPCRQAFERALRIDPSFDLAPGEHGHPLWGPEFTRAKQGAGR
ncbi:TssQ family T6SS-associated lipoprotein [Massilia sp. H6]|uniref:TssQ family T6SS-associated lipoprotein n=1 Tax=Massilia sp. H6 TaxID=2970464 RepID=UPI002169F832|nr:TssQ family T6SS-associated lipoprotein [Massilia sp. H6]UVW27462.1 TssQ family T6SS-associated lipoprotein [Massilia sp. H6]